MNTKFQIGEKVVVTPNLEYGPFPGDIFEVLEIYPDFFSDGQHGYGLIHLNAGSRGHLAMVPENEITLLT